MSIFPAAEDDLSSSGSDNDFQMSASRYPAPPVPAMDTSASATRLSPTPLRVVNTLPTIDVFPTYTMSPAVSYYAPATSPVTPALPVTSDYVSPGSPASMDRFLAGDSLLMDGPSDLPLLPLLLLPLPASSVLPPETVADHSPVDTVPSCASASPDLSREGPFDAHQGASVTGDAPLVLDSLPGCQYRMTSYDHAEVADVDPAYRLQLHHPCFLEYARVSTSFEPPF